MIDKLKAVAEVSKSGVSVVKDAIILIILSWVVAAPNSIKQRLISFGVTEGDLAGIKFKLLEDAKKQTAEAAQVNNQTKTDLVTYQQQISNLIKTTDNVATKDSLKNINTNISKSVASITRLDQNLKTAIIKQDSAITSAQPANNSKQSGWIYTGKITENRQNWASKSTIINENIGNNFSGTSLKNSPVKITDDVYLRSGGENIENFYTKLPIQNVVKKDKTVQIKNIGYTHALGGGWFVWFYIETL